MEWMKTKSTVAVDQYSIGADGILRTAVFDETGRYRYRLHQRWGKEIAECLFVMLNPSKADHKIDDPTIRKCRGFAQQWGMGGMYIGNLFAYRATKPSDMRKVLDPIGPDNRFHLDKMIQIIDRAGGKIVCAWGTNGEYLGQAGDFLNELKLDQIPAFALALTDKGSPQHPLYLPYESELIKL